jgi:hypothetical protein
MLLKEITAVYSENHTRLLTLISLNSVNKLMFIMMKCVLLDVRTEFLNIIQTSFGFKGLITQYSVRDC